jgi:hypothetical protein
MNSQHVFFAKAHCLPTRKFNRERQFLRLLDFGTSSETSTRLSEPMKIKIVQNKS